MLVPSTRSLIGRGPTLSGSRRGGLQGNPDAQLPGADEPAPDSPIRGAPWKPTTKPSVPPPSTSRLRSSMRSWISPPTTSGRSAWPAPLSRLIVTDADIMNVPENAVHSWDFFTPGNTFQETFSWRNPPETPGARAPRCSNLLINPVPPRYVVDAEGIRLGQVIQRMLLLIVVSAILLAGFPPSLHRASPAHHGADALRHFDCVLCHHPAPARAIFLRSTSPSSRKRAEAERSKRSKR